MIGLFSNPLITYEWVDFLLKSAMTDKSHFYCSLSPTGKLYVRYLSAIVLHPLRGRRFDLDCHSY